MIKASISWAIRGFVQTCNAMVSQVIHMKRELFALGCIFSFLQRGEMNNSAFHVVCLMQAVTHALADQPTETTFSGRNIISLFCVWHYMYSSGKGNVWPQGKEVVKLRGLHNIAFISGDKKEATKNWWYSQENAISAWSLASIARHTLLSVAAIV